MLRGPEHFVMHGRQRRMREALTQTAISRDRGVIGSHHEQNGHRNRSPPRFVDKSNVMGQRKKTFISFMTDVNDLGGVFVCHQMIEECHLAVDIVYGRSEERRVGKECRAWCRQAERE